MKSLLCLSSQKDVSTIFWKSFQWRQNVYSATMTINYWATVSRRFICSLEPYLNLTRIKIKSSAPDLSVEYLSTYFPLLVFRTGSRDSSVAAVGRQPGGELHNLSLFSHLLTSIVHCTSCIPCHCQYHCWQDEVLTDRQKDRNTESRNDK